MSTDEMLDAAVICVTWNAQRHIAVFLESLGPGLRGVDRWHLYVVDNASSDGTLDEVARLAPEATIIQTGFNAGYAAAINAALRAAEKSRAILVFNPDVRLDDGCVASLIRALDEPGIGITTPRQRDPSGRLLFTLRRTPSVRRALGEALLGGRRAGRHPSWGEVVMSPDAYEVRNSADWATGSALAISRECLSAVGHWDERFFLYSEETDYALRAGDRGFNVCLVPQAGCEHVTGNSHSSADLWALLMANRVRLFALRNPWARTAAFRLALVVGEAIRAGTGSPAHRAALLILLRGERGASLLIHHLQAAAPLDQPDGA